MLSERIAKLEERQVSEGEQVGQGLVARIRALVETFYDIASDVYDVGADLSNGNSVAASAKTGSTA